MSKHKPVSTAQISMLCECLYWENLRNENNPHMTGLPCWHRLHYLGEEMVMKALVKKGLVVRRYDDQIDAYYIALLPKARRYLSFISTLRKE